MPNSGPKRVVSSCIPCYTKKQKCNRRQPCDHCSRRRRPEECVYLSQPSQTPALRSPATLALGPVQSEDVANDLPVLGTHNDLIDTHDQGHDTASRTWNLTSNPSRDSLAVRKTQKKDSLIDLFGYLEDSESNTLALIRRLGLCEGEKQEREYHLATSLVPEASDEVRENIARIPDRPVLDFLIQFFVTDVHWIHQLVHLPWFLTQYQLWWNLERLPALGDVEFAVLLLRICSYASLFLPSPLHTIDRIHGILLADIRDICNDVADKLASVSARLHERGSLLRVQHLSFLGLRAQCEGQTNAFREAINSAVQVAQSIGIHRCFPESTLGMHELEKEMRRRVFCNLYIMDSHLLRQLDSIAFLPAYLSPESLPRMRLSPDVDADAPESFSERLLHARLASYWRAFDPKQGAEYDATVAEEKYEKFRSKFLASLPSIFALEPDNEWDERVPKLPLQRQILHIAIFEYLCHNFRPVLLLGPSQIQNLPAYKQVLLASQKKALAVAALGVLTGVQTLHTMLGASQTRFPGIVVSTFEAAVILGALCMEVDFPSKHEDTSYNGSPSSDPLGSVKSSVTWDQCFQGLHDALARLQLLATICKMASKGARTLAQMHAKIGAQRSSFQRLSTFDTNETPWLVSEASSSGVSAEVFSSSGDIYSWEEYSEVFVRE